MKIGDRVTTKKISLPVVGTIVGFVTADIYMIICGRPVTDFVGWNENYPEWTKGNVAIVKYDQPQYIMSYEEYLGQEPDATLEEYQRDIPKSLIASYPEDDIELF